MLEDGALTSVASLIAKAAKEFSNAELDTPQLDAKLLLQHVTGYSSAELISKSADSLTSAQTSIYFEYVNRRLNREPVHRITGEREFFGRSFVLSSETLIPRPDTETLVEAVLAKAPKSILEIGTGSGAIAVSLAAELGDVALTATDISSDALLTAANNAKAHEVADKIRFVKSDLFESLEGKFEAIVSNPPYIPSADLNDLQAEVRLFDPANALDGGDDGLGFYRVIFANAQHFLCSHGQIFLEFGIGQGRALCEVAEAEGFSKFKLINDLSGIDRVFTAQLKA